MLFREYKRTLSIYKTFLKKTFLKKIIFVVAFRYLVTFLNQNKNAVVFVKTQYL